MSSFDQIHRNTAILVKEILEYTGVRELVILNVLQYAKCLCRPSQPNHIEELVFISQMGERFGMTSMFHVKLMFDTVRLRNKRLIRVEDYVKLICMFITTRLDVKIDFAFSVYDFYHDQVLCINEMTTLLQTSIISTTNDDDFKDQLKELIQIVIFVFDTNHDGMISLEEFRKKVHGNILYIQLLGQVLPHNHVLEGFMTIMKNKSPIEVRNFFANEVATCLRDPILPKTAEKLYPVELDLP